MSSVRIKISCQQIIQYLKQVKMNKVWCDEEFCQWKLNKIAHRLHVLKTCVCSTTYFSHYQGILPYKCNLSSRAHTLTPHSSKPSRQMRRNTLRIDGCSSTLTFLRSPAMWCIMVKMQSFTISSFTLKFSRRRLYWRIMSIVANLVKRRRQS